MRRMIFTTVLLAGLLPAPAALAAPDGDDPARGSDTRTLTTRDGALFGRPNQGHWSPDVQNKAGNRNYLVGFLAGSEYRNFFTFDLRDVRRTITAATLTLEQGVNTAPLQYRIFDVSTPARRLNDTSGTSQEIFDDLGTGTSYGTFTVDRADRTVALRLNAAGVRALNAGRGGYVSLGGRVVHGRDYSFAGTGPDAQRLTITLR